MRVAHYLRSLERRAYLSLRTRAGNRVAGASTERRPHPRPQHLLTGERGEDLAYFHLEERGYPIVARRWHSSRMRGDLDLVAWDGDTLVVFEVKTRTARDMAPAETAVDAPKQRTLRRMAQAYRQRLPEPWRDLVPVRIDVLSVYDLPTGPEFEHFPNAVSFAVAS